MLDPLDPSPGFDPAPLVEVLGDPGVEVVLHAGRQDVAILRRQWGATFANVFDTQVAAGFAGFSAQAGYTGLLHDVLRIRLAKSASFTRWDARPLTPEQVALRPRGRRAPAGAGRRAAARLVEQGPARVGARGVPRDRRGDRRARSRGGVAAAAARVGLGPRERAVARELAAWRERVAAERGPAGRRGRARPDVSELAKRQPDEPPRAGADPRHRARGGPPARRRHPGRDRARPRGAADPARRGRAAGDRAAGRAGDRARRGARAHARPGGRAGLRADRGARRSRADRGRPPAAAAPSPTCGRCAAGGASWSAPSCSSSWPAGAR